LATGWVWALLFSFSLILSKRAIKLEYTPYSYAVTTCILKFVANRCALKLISTTSHKNNRSFPLVEIKHPFSFSNTRTPRASETFYVLYVYFPATCYTAIYIYPHPISLLFFFSPFLILGLITNPLSSLTITLPPHSHFHPPSHSLLSLL